MKEDRHLQAFYAESPQVFRAVSSVSDVWRYDPFDIPSIHRPARHLFSNLVAAATTLEGPGKILLLKGESGAGKTHLLRAFRNMVHGEGKGVVTYTQMKSNLQDYTVFLLRGFIESMDQRYYERSGSTTGLMRLSNALARPEGANTEDLELNDAAGAPAHDLFYQWADNLLNEPLFAGFSDADLLRALLYLQLDDAAIKARVLKYLRAEELTPYDRRLLGDITSRHQPGHAEDLLKGLGRLAGLMGGGACVMCVDQLDEMHTGAADEGAFFARAVETICRLAEHVPHSVFVVAVIDDIYDSLRPSVKRMYLDRLEQDPAPITLEVARDAPEIEAMVAARLAYLYEAQGVNAPVDRIYPFTRENLQQLASMRTRDVLDTCRLAQDLARSHQSAPRVSKNITRSTQQSSTQAFDQVWSDCQKQEVNDSALAEEALLGLVQASLKNIGSELPDGVQVLSQRQGSRLRVEVVQDGQPPRIHVLAVCNKSSQGGALGVQLRELLDEAHQGRPLALRSTLFPDSKGKTGAAIKELRERGGALVVENSEWRAMNNFAAFLEGHQTVPGFAQWRRQARPLRNLACLSEILGLHDCTYTSAGMAESASTASQASEATLAQAQSDPGPAAPSGPAAPLSGTTLNIGTEQGRRGQRLLLETQALLRHAAFLGGSGSGKTTLALNLIEQMVIQGVPTILIDRKGDLCAFADPLAWKAETEEDRQRAEALRAKAEIAIFTPGRADGRSLCISPVPVGLTAMDAADRGQSINFAAGALASMLGYSEKSKAKRAVLLSAIEVLGSEKEPSIQTLINLVEERDPELMAKLGPLDSKVCDKLVQDLAAMNITHGGMFSREGDPLDIGALFGRRPGRLPGRTSVAIISTKFFADADAQQFWLTQFLIELGRYVSKNPSSTLQGTVFFDEADQYLPAVGAPPTKKPMENLLKRARSAGISILLGTQSPGDLDYKCRDNVQTWFVGQVKEKTALNKLAWIGDQHIAGLATQKVGEFCLADAREVRRFKGQVSVVQTMQQSEAAIVAYARESRRA